MCEDLILNEELFQIQRNNYDQSEWHLQNVHLLRNFSSVTSVGIIEFNPVEVVYKLKLKRSTLFYNKVFCGPLLGLNQTFNTFKIDYIF